MKVKVDLNPGQSLEEAEEELYKALKHKKEAKETVGERYVDSAVNDFHELIMKEHLKVIDDIKSKLEYQIKQSKGV